jgi:hypothetical protein
MGLMYVERGGHQRQFKTQVVHMIITSLWKRWAPTTIHDEQSLLKEVGINNQS